ncbi:ribosomal subunit interface protein [Anoxybacter fermentans]|uniref:Ribosome hibernation promoting factor n=1 Tax=Anoxybacter fermentans TaxID=1323375 RepID=A0A3Q9HRP4_9FIRM|nr:ribosome-associated translation inhibitor RaiA [Anoxybacter fermentans]AZR73833.1 ribosomal subunit interface protein [Anoxybacter fermentans]
MKISIYGKNLEVTNALKNYVEEKVGKIEKYFNDAFIEAQVGLEVEKDRHIVEVTIKVDGLLLRGEESSGDMYASIDGVIDKLERQVHKYKTRINRKIRERKKEFKLNLANSFIVDDIEEVEPKIVKTKRFAIKPMSVEEAIMQMDLIGHDFFVFVNAATEEVNVVYKRKNGQYGLLEPEF